MPAAAATAKAKLSPEQLKDRNERILLAHKKGASNKQIGEAISLHPGNVAKIIKAAREAGELGQIGSAKGNGEAGDDHPVSSRKAKPAKSTPTKARRRRDGLSLIDAAHIILKRAHGGPLHPLIIVERAVAGGLWKFMKGKTPSATLWSRMLAEIKLGSAKSRFRLESPGMFGLTALGMKCETKKAGGAA